MPKIVSKESYGGAEARIQRLGLAPLWGELTLPHTHHICTNCNHEWVQGG